MNFLLEHRLFHAGTVDDDLIFATERDWENLRWSWPWRTEPDALADDSSVGFRDGALKLLRFFFRFCLVTDTRRGSRRLRFSGTPQP